MAKRQPPALPLKESQNQISGGADSTTDAINEPHTFESPDQTLEYILSTPPRHITRSVSRLARAFHSSPAAKVSQTRASVGTGFSASRIRERRSPRSSRFEEIEDSQSSSQTTQQSQSARKRSGDDTEKEVSSLPCPATKKRMGSVQSSVLVDAPTATQSTTAETPRALPKRTFARPAGNCPALARTTPLVRGPIPAVGKQTTKDTISPLRLSSNSTGNCLSVAAGKPSFNRPKGKTNVTTRERISSSPQPADSLSTVKLASYPAETYAASGTLPENNPLLTLRIPLLDPTIQTLSLQHWDASWGTYCRKTSSRENQDGWFVSRMSLVDENSLTDLNSWGCHIAQDSHNNVFSRPPVGSSAWPVAITSDDSAGPPGPIRDNCVSLRRPWIFGVLDGHGCGGRVASHEGARAMIRVLDKMLNQMLLPLYTPPPKCTLIQGDNTALPASKHMIATSEPSKIEFGMEQQFRNPLSACFPPNSCATHVSHNGAITGAINMASTDLSETALVRRYLMVDAAHSASEAEAKAIILRLRDTIIEVFRQAHLSILSKNEHDTRDYGTTATVTFCAGRYLLTGTCGDSSSYLIVAPSKAAFVSDQSLPRIAVNLRLSSDHTLTSPVERHRITTQKKGRIVTGDGGVLRLIPYTMTYVEAKTHGLSINMARALGHILLSQHGLSPEPQITLVDVSDVFTSLAREIQNRATDAKAKETSAAYSNNQRLPWKQLMYDGQEYGVTLSRKFGSIQPRDFDLNSHLINRPSAGDLAIPRQTRKSKVEPKRVDNEEPREGISSNQRSKSTHCQIASAKPQSPVEMNSGSDPPMVTRKVKRAASHSSNNTTGLAETDTTASQKSEADSVGAKPILPRSQNAWWREFASESKTLQILKECVVFLLLVSDGVTDVFTREEMGNVILSMNDRDVSPYEIAKNLTAMAEDSRQKRGYRPDNCTAVIVKLALPTSAT